MSAYGIGLYHGLRQRNLVLRTNYTGIISDLASEGVSQDLALVRAALLGEELRERVTQPVKETLSAGSMVLDAGQRLSGWIASLIKASPAA